MVEHVTDYIQSEADKAWPHPFGGEPPLGAHLVTPRGLYFHHGIYVGQGRVIHYAGLSRGFCRGPVEEVSLDGFTRGRGLRVRYATPADCDRNRIVQRARSRLGERRYRILTNNCAHFSVWCLYGQSRRERIAAWPRRVLLNARHTLTRWFFRVLIPDRISTVS